MAIFQQILWGYELTYPDHWVHHQAQGVEIFSEPAEAPELLEAGLAAGQVQVQGEWNWARQPVEPLWNRHIGLMAGMLGAKKVGSAPWHIAGMHGLEAEIVLPKKENRRLWTGVLTRDFRVLHFLVMHAKEARAQFEPLATRLIASLRFPQGMAGIETSPEGLPLPPGYTPVDPQSILNDIADPTPWRAYAGEAGVGALQAFYLRELPAHNWQMEEYVPFPAPGDLGFARLRLRSDRLRLTLGLMPAAAAESSGAIPPAGGSTPASVVFKLSEL